MAVEPTKPIAMPGEGASMAEESTTRSPETENTTVQEDEGPASDAEAAA